MTVRRVWPAGMGYNNFYPMQWQAADEAELPCFSRSLVAIAMI
jgi:hypothetical protein